MMTLHAGSVHHWILKVDQWIYCVSHILRAPKTHIQSQTAITSYDIKIMITVSNTIMIIFNQIVMAFCTESVTCLHYSQI